MDTDGLPLPNARLPIGSWATNRTFWVTLLLALLALAVFWPVTRNEFTCYDDPDYVLNNPHVQTGLTWQGLVWAFGRLHTEQTYWHPLTWVSHMLDCQLFGLNPTGHHLVNLLLHTLNTVLVFLVFRRMTGAVWRCAVLAVLFALHPLQVDTVAWVAERKNLLSALFWLLTMWAYVSYAEGRRKNAECRMRSPGCGLEPPASRITHHPSVYYLLALLFFTLGLMCKPVLVTLPFALLLLDYWPLQRLSPPTLNPQPSTILSLAAEKAPFLLLALASSIITLASHRALKGMMDAAAGLPLAPRLENALVSYVRYLGKTLWPSHLAVFYPHPVSWPMWAVALSGLLLLGVSALAGGNARRRPYLLVGWFWFLGVLVPFTGVVQAGAQAMADRFAYVPLLGLFLALIWGAYDVTVRWRHRTTILCSSAVAATALCATLSRHQIGYWRDSQTLFEHAVAVTEGNDVAHYNLGVILADKGLVDEAIRHYEAAVRLSPQDGQCHDGLGYALLQKGRFTEAANQYREALRLNPADAQAHNNLGHLLVRQGQVDEAIEHLTESLRLDANKPEAHCNLGLALARRGSYPEAIEQYRVALRLEPGNAAAHAELGSLLAEHGQLNEAIGHYTQAARLTPKSPNAQYRLGMALAKKGEWEPAARQFNLALALEPNFALAHYELGMICLRQRQVAKALEHWRETARLKPDWPDALNNLAWVLATDPRPALRNGAEAVELASRAAELSGTNDVRILDSLAAAYAETGRFGEAVSTALRAKAAALAQGHPEVAAEIEQRLALYQSNKPYREHPFTQ